MVRFEKRFSVREGEASEKDKFDIVVREIIKTTIEQGRGIGAIADDQPIIGRHIVARKLFVVFREAA